MTEPKTTVKIKVKMQGRPSLESPELDLQSPNSQEQQTIADVLRIEKCP